ncbi:restriction endonuclease subunit S [Vibrio parahaemolyticus]|uniref:restriction endonuclease subunit S n=1 Tax=Vibrio parahaemolyticus TaxID=670 RepID=UPI00111DF798|nr:restriction endonuclease subunit S [Vibrio parahaemolyticus]MBD2857287.1 restriction endonuclease subunit S [Vibrio parahaemolyticus]MBW6448859.1 restriction endonuclease subunit S [Vibrio parahaemolyticus]TPA39108.1 restriction endonuclease subunit S [Vibrio parahaemolyticus]HAS3130123.1 restriction endonuclease subunit S [Vibrio parahaemolyticus]
MTGRYKAYPEYKESGVEWLGKVPQNWSIHSLKRTIDRVTNGIWGSEPDNENDLIVLRVADFNRNQLNISDDKLTFRAIEPKDRTSRLLKKGDLLIEKSGGGDKTLVGCVVLFDKDYPAVTSNFVAKMTPKKGFDSSFLRYAFSQLYTGKVNFPSIKQTTGIQNLDSDAYLQESFVFPSYEEQQKIANFLDHETAKIDTLITKQEKLIELLKEKRQAVISHAVTKGLNPNAPMKDSGVEWLGEVPEHWFVVPIKRMCEVKDGTHDTPKYVDKGENSFPLITSKDFEGKNISFESAKYISKEAHREIVKRSNTEVGDVLMSMIGGNIGKALIVKETAEFSIKNVALFKTTRKSALASYILYYLESGLLDIQISLQSRGGAQGFLSLGDLRNLVFFKVPEDELNTIVEHLDLKISKYDRLINIASDKIALLSERKTALISAAVTGKIDVRDWDAQGVQG